MGINPGKIGPPPVPRLQSAGGWVGAKPPRHNARPGRPGLAGRGNDAGAANRILETEEIGQEVFDAVELAAELTPGIETIDEPTYAEQLNAIRTPVGGIEFLWSGTDPVEPGNCDLWPDSPLCGGSVMDPGGIGRYGPEAISGSINVSVSPTEWLVQIDFSIFAVNLPPVWLGFRRPGAQDAVDGYWGPGGRMATPAGSQSFGGPGSTITWVIFRDIYESFTVTETLGNLPEYMLSFRNIVYATVPPTALQSGGGGRTFRFAYLRDTIEEGFTAYRNARANGLINSGNPMATPGVRYAFIRGRIQVQTTKVQIAPPLFPPEFGYQFNPDYTPWGTFVATQTDTPPQGIPRQREIVTPQSVHAPRVIAIPWNPPMPPPPPPTLPPRSPALPEDPPMACDCKKIEDLLKKILALLDHEGTRELDLTPCETDPDAPSGNRKYTWQGKGLKGVFDALEKLTDGATETYQSSKCVAPALGVKKLPWDLPGNMGDGEGSETVDNYAELQIYILKQLSQMLGQTKIKIKVKDSDLVAEGNQTKELEFENVSEAMAELLGLALTNQSIASAGLNASLTGVVQSGMAFTTAAVIDKHIEEIVEFLGFSQKRSAFQVPLPYTPGGTTPEEILKDTVVNLRYYENVDRRTFQSHAVIMEQAAAIIRAAFYERIGSEFTGVSDVKEKITTAAEQAFGDFDTFLEDVEQGFTGAPGATDITPYGRAYGERPRIRKIGGSSANDGTNP